MRQTYIDRAIDILHTKRFRCGTEHCDFFRAGLQRAAKPCTSWKEVVSDGESLGMKRKSITHTIGRSIGDETTDLVRWV